METAGRGGGGLWVVKGAPISGEGAVFGAAVAGRSFKIGVKPFSDPGCFGLLGGLGWWCGDLNCHLPPTTWLGALVTGGTGFQSRRPNATEITDGWHRVCVEPCIG